MTRSASCNAVTSNVVTTIVFLTQAMACKSHFQFQPEHLRAQNQISASTPQRYEATHVWKLINMDSLTGRQQI